MKRKKALIAIFSFLIALLFFVLGCYFIYYKIFLKDERVQYLPELGSAYSSTYNVREVYVLEFDKLNCELVYCLSSDCSGVLNLPCESLKEDSYQGQGRYKISLDFEKYKYFPFNKMCLKSWSLEPLGGQNFTVESYLLGLKELLRQKYIWEIYSIPVSISPASTEDWFNNGEVFFNNDYFKSIWLMNQLFLRLGESEFHEYFNREIEYLNFNKEKLLKQNTSLYFPEAYILKLVDNGLDSEYLSLLSNFSIINSPEEYLFEIKSNSEPLLLKENSLYSKEYKDIVRYSDYYRIFREYGEEELANYSYNKMLEAYNDSGFFVYGLCSLAYSDNELIRPEILKGFLEEIFSNDKTELIEGSVYELSMCDQYSKKRGVEIKDLDSKKQLTLELSSVDIVGEGTFLIRGLPVTSQREEGKDFITVLNYSLVDHITYLLGSL